MNYLGLDYGRKRVGVSIFLQAVGVVLPMPAVTAECDSEKIEKIVQLIQQNGINVIVIGYPYNIDGTIGNSAKTVDRFVENLSKKIPSDIVIHRSDERLTSEHATHSSHGGVQKKSHAKTKAHRARGIIDSLAAALILQDFIDELNLV